MPGVEGAAVCIVRRNGTGARELSPHEFARIDALIADPQTVVWLALRDPTDKELRLLEEEFGVHPLAVEDVRKREQRSKLDTYGDQYMLVVFEALETASAEPADEGSGRQSAFELSELHALGSHDWLVTVQWSDSPAIEVARAHFQRSNGALAPSVASTLYTLFDAAADSYFPVLDRMAERMDALEDRVLAATEGTNGLREMLLIKRELLELRRVLAPMREAANSILRRDIAIVDDAAVPYFQDLYDHLVRILDQLDLYRDLLGSIVDARLTMTSNSLNAVMKRLTAITVILMAPTLIAGIYGMNFHFMPELGWSLGYPFVLGLMALVMVGAFVYFRRRDWF